MGKAENRVVKSCREWIAMHGGKVVRVQSGMMRWGEGKMMQMAESGTADLVGAWYGRALAVECKTAKGKQSQTQADWQVEWERSGGVYVLARSTLDLEVALVVKS